MHTLRLLSLSAALLLAATATAGAQFLRKLKNSVTTAVNTLGTEAGTAAAPSGGEGITNPRGIKATTGELSAFSPEKLYTLQPGEIFDFSESCLLAKADIFHPQVVIKKGTQRFVAGPGGTRKPLAGGNVSGCPMQGADEGSPRLTSFPDLITEAETQTVPAHGNELSRYVRISINDPKGPGAYIDFKGKHYGPYGSVTSLVFNAAKDRFKAVVMLRSEDKDTSGTLHFLLIGSDGQQTRLPFSYTCYLIPYGSFDTPRILGTNMDDLTHQVLYDPRTEQGIRILHDDGNPPLYIDRTTGALLYASGREIYIDEKLVKTLPEGSRMLARHLYVSFDHRRWAAWTASGLYFSGHQRVDGVISCHYQAGDGGGELSWMVLGADDKTIYLCHDSL